MLTGQELGKALAEAMRRKGVTQGAVASEFGVSQPSVSEWIKYGRIGKQHLTRLVEFFAGVVGPEHWGMPPTWGANNTTSLPLDDLRGREVALLMLYRQLDPDAQARLLEEARRISLGGKGAWPFRLPRADIDALTERQLGELEGAMKRELRAFKLGQMEGRRVLAQAALAALDKEAAAMEAAQRAPGATPPPSGSAAAHEPPHARKPTSVRKKTASR